MATNILNDELEHEHDIEDFLNDINLMREDLKKLKLDQ
jgi:bacterioferritin